MTTFRQKLFVTVLSIFIISQVQGQVEKSKRKGISITETALSMRADGKNKRAIHEHLKKAVTQSSLANKRTKPTELIILDGIRSQYWDETTSKWIDSYQEEFLFNSDDQLWKYRSSYFDQSYDEWFDEYLYEYSYDDNGNLTLLKNSYWDFFTEEYLLSFKENFSYENSYLVEHISETWNDSTSEWENYIKIENTYNSEGLLVEDFYSWWSDSLNSWETYYKGLYEYDENDNMIKYTDYEWNFITEEWLKYYISLNTFSNNYLTENSTQQYDFFNDEWITYSEAEYEYDENGNPSKETYYELPWNGENVILSSVYEYKYNNSIEYDNITAIPLNMLLPDNSDKVINQPIETLLKFWNDSTDMWEMGQKIVYNYSEKEPSSTSLKSSISIQVFPNPVSSNLNIHIDSKINQQSKFNLYDLNGKLILSKNFNSSTSLDLSEINNGIYIYTIAFKDELINGKLHKNPYK
ncbi:MAG: T9SS type A sorting domain-containing protein [Bacteroidia bacterium]